MADFWGSLKKNITQGIKTVSVKTEELTQVGRLKVEIIAVKRDIEKSFIELGGRVYHQVVTDDSNEVKIDENIQELISSVIELEKKLKKLEKEISRVQSEGKIKLEKNRKP